MEEFFTNLYSNSSTPFFSALLLGLLTSISPCPLATNITAIGFIGRNLENRNRVFISGLVYTFGRAFAYTLLALIIYFGADQFKISGIFQQYGEKFIGPILIVIGLFMFGIVKINFPGFSNFFKKFENRETQNYWDVFLLGNIFALAFCPYSGVLYFGMLIPLTIASAKGLFLPIVFAVATGIPVIIFAWILAFTASGVGNLYKNLKKFEIYFRKVVALVFILVGIYYIILIYF